MSTWPALGHTDVLVVAPTDDAPAGSAVRVIDPPHLDVVDYGVPALRAVRRPRRARSRWSRPGRTTSPPASGSREWLLEQRRPLPTAVVGLSDVLALGVLEGLDAAGVDVPGTVSVCGFDDIPAAAPRGLTTVRQPITERGREIGRMLLDPDEPPRQVLMPVELVVRRSSGRPHGLRCG